MILSLTIPEVLQILDLDYLPAKTYSWDKIPTMTTDHPILLTWSQPDPSKIEITNGMVVVRQNVKLDKNFTVYCLTSEQDNLVRQSIPYGLFQLSDCQFEDSLLERFMNVKYLPTRTINRKEVYVTSD